MGVVVIQKRNPAPPHFGLTSLMDVLTILLIFLLVNYSDQFNDVPDFVSLPVAKSSLGDKENATGNSALIVADKILVGARSISLNPWRPADILAQLSAEFANTDNNDTLFIIADKEVPYRTVDLVVTAASKKGILKVNFLAKSGK